MNGRALPPVAAVISFINRINRGDVEGLSAMMTDDHELIVFDENPLPGQTANMKAWAGYVAAYPRYVIYPQAITEPRDGCVAVIGHTTGSHLGLADEETQAVRHLVRRGRGRAAAVLAAAGGFTRSPQRVRLRPNRVSSPLRCPARRRFLVL
jgi:hypothetical protein